MKIKLLYIAITIIAISCKSSNKASQGQTNKNEFPNQISFEHKQNLSQQKDDNTNSSNEIQNNTEYFDTPILVIQSLAKKTNSRYISTFYDKAIYESNVLSTECDTIYVLEHYFDINYSHDKGIIWNNKNMYWNYKLLHTWDKKTTGSPYRYYSGIEIYSRAKSDDFSQERILIENWNINKIKSSESQYQKLAGSFFAIRICKIGSYWKGDYITFNDLRDYELIDN